MTSATKPPVKPQDRKPSAADEKRRKAEFDQMMSTGIDLTPFTLDVGDGTKWDFVPDPMPSDTERLRLANARLQEASSAYAEKPDDRSLAEANGQAFAGLVEAISTLLLDADDRGRFVGRFRGPLDLPDRSKPYGQRVAVWFLGHVATGRDGFPTEEA